MIIREQYVDVIEAIAAQAGIKRAYPAEYRVSARATRAACLRYTLRYVVRHRLQHYRYNQYRGLLTWALRDGPDFGKDGPLLHFDLGCGPGLFGWVVRDVFLDQRISVEHYGYDHSRAMVELASEIWSQLSVDEIASWHDRPEDVLAAALAAGPRFAGTLVTLGHVLAQTHDQAGVIADFAHIIFESTALNCLLVAFDAKSATKGFHLGCERLVATLRELGLEVDVLHRGGQRFFASVRR